jgi:hypothetical protein
MVRAEKTVLNALKGLPNKFLEKLMARWRTLHEISVVATVLVDRGEEIAKRYVAHEVVEAKSAMDEYERSWLPLGYPPVSDRRKKHLLASYKEVIDAFGKPFGSTYGWAAHHLKRSKPIFSDLEEAAGRTPTRPYYKMASYNVHASPRGVRSSKRAETGKISTIASTIAHWIDILSFNINNLGNLFLGLKIRRG